MQGDQDRFARRLGRLSIAMAGMVAICSSCASFSDNTLGDHGNFVAHEGLTLEIACVNEDQVVVGQPILFDLTLRNTGTAPVNLPREPYIGMKWRYSNGLYDGFLPPSPPACVNSRDELITLDPGETLNIRRRVRTSHFTSVRGGIGINEFRAAYSSVNNVSSNLLPLWEGVLVSNTYGVEVIRPDPR